MARTPRRGPAGQESSVVQGTLDQLLESLDRLPGPIQARIRRELLELKALILDQRPPRILIVGRRGSGKSSLINAIFQKPVATVGPVRAQTGRGAWYSYATSRGELKIVDTRGFGEGVKPEAAELATAEAEVVEAVRAEEPDVLLFLCKAKEIDARIGEDIRSLLTVHRTIESLHDYPCPIVGLVTQVDELDPLRIGPPYDEARKRAHIEEAVAALEQAFAAAGHPLERVFPISTYLEFAGETIVDSRVWNLDRLLEYLVEILPQSARLTMARTARIAAIQKKVANEVVTGFTVVCGGIAAIPIPIADTIPLTAAQVLMVTTIGSLAGRAMNRQTAVEFISAMGLNVGAGFALRQLARSLVKLIPVAGSVVSAGVAAAGTWALGQAAILYFLEGKSAAEAKAQFEARKSAPPPAAPPEDEEPPATAD